MPLQATSGAASYDAFGGGVPVVPAYIEEVFSTYLYTGNGSTQTITNGIDLAGEGGLVWIKSRSAAAEHHLTDTARGMQYTLHSDLTDAQYSTSRVSANSDGFSLTSTAAGEVNTSGRSYASWTFRKQPKFFDVVTYTGNGTSQAIAHNLTSPPGCIIIKATSTTADWVVYARYDEIDPTTPLYKDLRLNTTAASTQNVAIAGATSFTVGGLGDPVNTNGVQYVAYLFAHNAGGFGLTGTDNVISCGSFTTTSGINSINLGYEPQWVLIKQTNAAQSWWLMDTMRGFSVTSYSRLFPDQSSAESVASGPYITPTATGFTFDASIFGTGNTYIYTTIRRGPMKVPTSGTSVFLPQLANTSAPTYRASFTIDMVMALQRTGGSHYIGDRLRGAVISDTTSTAAEASYANEKWDYQTSALSYASGPSYEVGQCFRRAPGFFDEVCYTGTGSNLTLPHNLTVAPELVIAKVRSTGSSWGVSTSADWTKYLLLNSTNAQASASLFGTPDATNFYPTASGGFSGSGNTYVAYLFATCAGVSKVGSYTGNGSSQVINCGFTSGARFVLIKSTTEARSWCVFDTARGIASGNDPVLYLQDTGAEVTSIDWLAPNSSGFEIVTSQGNVNGSGQTYIYLAIA